MNGRTQRYRTRSRCASVCLSAAIASVLVGLFPSSAVAARDVHSQIKTASRAPFVRLQLSDGSSVQGTFGGFLGDWRDSVTSVARYEAWQATRPSGVPWLGDPLVLVLTSGDTLRGTFGGVGRELLLLGQANSVVLAPVAHDVVARVHWQQGDSSASWAELRARLLEAPDRVAVKLKYAARAMVVPQEAIVSASGMTGDGQTPSSELPGILSLVVAAGVIVFCVVMVREAHSELTSTCSLPIPMGSIDRQFESHGLSDRAGPGRPRGSIHP